MVERSVCSVEGENNTSRGYSGNVETVVRRDEDPKAPEVTETLERASDNQKSRQSRLSKFTESSRLTVSRDSGESRGIPTPGGRFSLFKWFKRGSRDTSCVDRTKDRERDRECSDLDENDITSDDLLSSNESVETLYSTATVRSFAFKVGAPAGIERETIGDEPRRHLSAGPVPSDFTDGGSRRVGPFGVGASKIVTKLEDARDQRSTKTLPASVSSRRLDITARYSLQSCDDGITGGFGSCGNIAVDKEDWATGSRAGGSRGRIRVHVRGKRRAPDPPEVARGRRSCGGTIGSGEKTLRRRKRRQAPKPPDVGKITPDNDIVSAPAEGISGSVATRPTGSASVRANEESGGIDAKGWWGAREKEEIKGSSFKIEDGIGDLSGSARGMSVGDTVSDDAGRFEDSVLSGDEKSTVRRNEASVVERRSDLEFSLSRPSGNVELAGTISNDSLVLQGGVLHSNRDSVSSSKWGVSSRAREAEGSPVDNTKGRCIFVATGSQTSSAAMPRPWYKRNVFEHNRDPGTSRPNGLQRNSTCREARTTGNPDDKVPPLSSPKLVNSDKCQDGGTPGRLSFFNRSDKRKSGLTMLANISELDKEAAAIVQEEQARARAAAKLLRAARVNDEIANNGEETEDVVQEIVNSAMESSPGRGTRALISKFNAISNRTRMTVNASFFAKNSSARDPRMEKPEEAPRSFRSQDIRTDKDLSRFFLPSKRSVEAKKTMVEREEDGGSREETTRVSARLSFFQNIPSDSNFRGSPKLSRFDGLKVATRHGSDETRRKMLTGSFEMEKKNKEEEEDERVDDRESMKRELTDIFRDIDEKLSSNEFKLVVDEERVPEQSASGRIGKVLDILVEAEKREAGDYSRSPKEGRGLSERSGINVERTSTGGSRVGPPVNPEKADLREMLKEMKHSLPKRPKPRRACDLDPSSTPSRSSADVGGRFSSAESSGPGLVGPVKASYPPPIRIGGSAIGDYLERSNERVGDYERQKVSSSAQTSGNLRRLTEPRCSVGDNKPSKWHNEDVIYRTSGKGVAVTSGLTKNTFQLIRPREFARIEAIKTLKNTGAGGGENTYANVMDSSLYANAVVEARSKNILPEATKRRFSDDKKKMADPSGEGRTAAEITAPDVTTPGPQNMNTLAVNRLLRKLEAAIASGHHQQAAGLAKELATLKIHCSVVRQRTEKKDLINVNMYIEDKLAHQGPIPLRLTRAMTVAELKAKVFTEFEIPANVQRWIVGKNLANDDTARLVDLQAVDGSSVFLYLVAPELRIDEAPLIDEKVAPPEQDRKIDLSPKEFVECANLSTPEESSVIQNTGEEEEEEEDEEEEENEKCISAEMRMERYEALISLENCDVIPNSEPIECPICFVTYGPQEGVILRDCLHIFCRPCIANTIRYCEEAEVKCPYRDTEYTCESTLQEREIKALVEPEVYQQHLAKSIAQAENNAGNNAFHCKTPDCPGWCIYDDNVNNFLCPVCGVNNCLTCQVVHTGKNCRQYQEELRMSKETDQESKRTAAMLEEMVDRGEALPCPTCAVVLMKKWGCDWLRCSMCKTEICWVTRGPRWGPGGKGDTSGGCRCGEKGIKCHPRCNYCH